MQTENVNLIYHHIDVATTNITFEGCLVTFSEAFEKDVKNLPFDNSTITASD